MIDNNFQQNTTRQVYIWLNSNFHFVAYTEEKLKKVKVLKTGIKYLTGIYALNSRLVHKIKLAAVQISEINLTLRKTPKKYITQFYRLKVRFGS